METLYIGTNTDLGGKGIYSVTLSSPALPPPPDATPNPRTPSTERNPSVTTSATTSTVHATSAQQSAALCAETGNPSYLAFSRNRKTLYVASENAAGSLLAYSVGSGRLMLESRTDTGTGGLVHLALDSRERFIFAASYEDARVLMFRLTDSGRAAEKVFEAGHEGSGPNQERQEKAHAHSVWLTPDENELCVCDLGTDRLVVYGIDYERGTLTRREERSVAFPPGAGPRHLAFTPDGRRAYVVGELDCRLYGFSWSRERGFTPRQTVSLVDSPRPDSTAAAIRITRDGRFVYASVRGEDIIVCHAIRSDGTLADRQVVSSRGAHPRDFTLSPAEDRLYCANRDSDSVACFLRDAKTGRLVFMEEIKGVKSPIAVMVSEPCNDSLAGGSGA